MANKLTWLQRMDLKVLLDNTDYRGNPDISFEDVVSLIEVILNEDN